MKALLLSGFGIIISVDGRKLIINKRQDNEKIAFHPHQIAYDNVIIDGNYGSISFEALRWLSKLYSFIIILSFIRFHKCLIDTLNYKVYKNLIELIFL